MHPEKKQRNQRPHSSFNEEKLRVRLAPFLERGLLTAVPNSWQLLQGTLEMMPYVVSYDATSEASYRRHILASPAVRQLFLVREIGWDHLNIGAGLSVSRESICKHLLFTWHEGMPTYDLQLAQTHPDGLSELRHRLQAAMRPKTDEDHRLRRQAGRLFPDPDAYFMRFLADGGWLDRAHAFDYPSASAEGGRLPEEFYSLVNFLHHCLHKPATLQDVGVFKAPAHLALLGLRRFRDHVGLRSTRAV